MLWALLRFLIPIDVRSQVCKPGRILRRGVRCLLENNLRVAHMRIVLCGSAAAGALKYRRYTKKSMPQTPGEILWPSTINTFWMLAKTPTQKASRPRNQPLAALLWLHLFPLCWREDPSSALTKQCHPLIVPRKSSGPPTYIPWLVLCLLGVLLKERVPKQRRSRNYGKEYEILPLPASGNKVRKM